MKKLLALTMISGILVNSVFAVQQDSEKLVSIDSIMLMQKSKEGQKLALEVQKEVESFQNFAKTKQEELRDFQETVSKQAKVLSKEALMEKGEKLASMKKTAERELSDKEEFLKKSMQRRTVVLRNKQMAVANTVFEKKSWGLMIDRNTPGVLFVKKAIDVTEEILKSVDDDFDKKVVSKVVENTQGKAKPSKKSA